MKIHTLSLTNYRGVKELTLELDKTINVFLGANGAGKSTILDAAAVMLSWAVNRMKHAGVSGRPITESDIANGTPAAGIEIHCVDESSEVSWKIAKRRPGNRGEAQRSQYDALNIYSKQMQEAITTAEEKLNLPLFVYYPVNRTVLDIPLRIRGKHKFSLFAAYDDALTSGANFRTFFEWFREREDLENENMKHGKTFEPFKQYPDTYDKIKTTYFNFPDPQLEAVRNALEQFLPEFKNIAVRRNPLRMEIEKNGEKLTVNQLSDGEKCLMAMVGDLARRLAMANPVGDHPLEGHGIAMIDEIDLHLHPKWQRMIIPRLTDVFPNLQFLISTHSPHVITHVQPENLYLLTLTKKGVACEHPGESYGKNVDRILEDLMGLETTRPDEINRELSDLFKIISDGELDLATKKLNALRGKIGEDPELVKASVLIRRRESIGK